MPEDWFVKNEDASVEGPYLEKDIAAKLLSGEISDTQRVRQGTAGDWCESPRARAVFQQLAEQGWYIRSDGNEFGPFTEHRVRELFQKGDLGSHAEVRRGTKMPWRPAADLSLLHQQQKASGVEVVPSPTQGGGVELPSSTAGKDGTSDGSVDANGASTLSPGLSRQPAQAGVNQAGANSSEGVVPSHGSKWSTEPLRHVLMELDEVVGAIAVRCETLECLLLQHELNCVWVTRGDGAKLGKLNKSDSQLLLSNSDRGVLHVTLLHSQPSLIPVRVAVVCCSPGFGSDDCRKYIDQQFGPLASA